MNEKNIFFTFDAEKKDAQRFVKRRKSHPTGHNPLEMSRIYGRNGDQTRVIKPVEGRQEILIEDSQLKKLYSPEGLRLKKVNKPKKPFKENDIVLLSPDRAEPIEAVITRIINDPKSGQFDLVVKLQNT